MSPEPQKIRMALIAQASEHFGAAQRIYGECVPGPKRNRDVRQRKKIAEGLSFLAAMPDAALTAFWEALP